MDENTLVSLVISGSNAQIAVTYGEEEEGFIPYRQLQQYTGEPAPFVPIDPKESLSCLYFSSGTTGKPKGVMHSHSTLVALIHLLEYVKICLLSKPVGNSNNTSFGRLYEKFKHLKN